jgi:hypothetical protein
MSEIHGSSKKKIQVSPGTPVSSTNIADCHDITEILLKVALNTITLTLPLFIIQSS